jgi:hypothetical protein
MRQVCVDRLMEDTRRIAGWVRLSGSAPEAESAAYVRDQLAAAGLESEIVWHDALISLPGPARLVVAGREIECITHSFSASTPPAGLDGELVYVGRGTAAEYARADVRGKIALIEGLAGPEPVKTAAEHGAVGHVHINDAHLHEMTVSPVWGSPAAGQEALLPRTPALSVRAEDGAWLKDQLALGAVHITMQAVVDTGWRRIPLVVGSLAGREEPERYVLLSGHLDSWHHGAMDNGSANATMLEAARVLAGRAAELRRGLRVAFWSGHSHGRYAGSAWYADEHWLDLEQHCVAHVNVDSTGAVGAVVLGEANVMAEARDLAAAAVAAVWPGEQFTGTRFGRAGDQSFWGAGVPSLYMSLSQQPAQGGATAESFASIIGPGRGRAGGLGWWWHTAHDTVDRISPDYLLRDTRIYVLTLYRLLASPVLPLDYRPVADEFRQAVRDAARRAPVSRQRLSPLHSELDELQVALERVALAIARLAWYSETAPSRRRVSRSARGDALRSANLLLMRLGRALIPANYVAGSVYEQDLALPTRPLPALQNAVDALAATAPDTDERRSAQVTLARSINRIRHAILSARRLADEWLDRYEPGR